MITTTVHIQSVCADSYTILLRFYNIIFILKSLFLFRFIVFCLFIIFDRGMQIPSWRNLHSRVSITNSTTSHLKKPPRRFLILNFVIQNSFFCLFSGKYVLHFFPCYPHQFWPFLKDFQKFLQLKVAICHFHFIPCTTSSLLFLDARNKSNTKQLGSTLHWGRLMLSQVVLCFKLVS